VILKISVRNSNRTNCFITERDRNIKRNNSFFGRKSYENQVNLWYLFATGWTVRRSNPGGGNILCTCPDRSWGPPSLLYNGYPVIPKGKTAWGVMLTTHPPSKAEVVGRVELYFYSPSGPFWLFLGWILPLPLTLHKFSHRRYSLKKPSLTDK